MRLYRVDPVTAWGPNGAAHGPHHERALDAHDIARLSERRAAGWSIEALANTYGVSKRTVYRYAQARVHRVEVDGYEALFATGHRSSPWPVQLTRWRRAVASGAA
jgi:transposase